MRKLVVIALLAVCASVHATGGISGVVTDSATGLPIHYARVCCRAESSVAYTDSNGYYLLSPLPPGEYTVRANATGYAGDTYPEPVVVVDSVVTESIDFALLPLPPTGISGRITDYETGDPIYHATLSGSGLPTVYSESSGAYFIPTNPGWYVLWAAHDGWLNGIYPESIHVEQGVVTESINFALIPITGKTGIGGRLTDASRVLGIGGGTVIASGPGGCDTATSVPTGGYLISGLATGKYQLTAEAEGFQTVVLTESVAVESGVVRWCPFYMQPDSTYYGCMAGMATKASDGLPLFGALITATSAGQGQANTGTQGAYTVRNLVPGTYLVRASAAGFEPSTWDTVEVTAGNTVSGVNFVLPASGSGNGGIAGNVSDSASQNPINHARVFAWGSDGQSYAYSDSAGDDAITGLTDGWYRVRAEARGYYPACYPESVEVAGGQTTGNIDFRLRPVGGTKAGIAGFAYDGYQQVEIPGAHVRVTSDQGFWEVYAGSSGDYLLDGLPPGQYVVQAEASGYEFGQYPDIVTIANGGVASFISPALYPLTPVAEPRVPAGALTSILVATPNPARGAVRVQWQVKEPGVVTLRVFDNAGRAVHTIQNGFQAAGSYSASWNGICDNGLRAANGILFYRLDAPGIHRVVKVTIVSR